MPLSQPSLLIRHLKLHSSSWFMPRLPYLLPAHASESIICFRDRRCGHPPMLSQVPSPPTTHPSAKSLACSVFCSPSLDLELDALLSSTMFEAYETR